MHLISGSCLANSASHAIRPFDGAQDFLGDALWVGGRVGVSGDRCRRAAALRRIYVDPTLRLSRVRIPVMTSADSAA